VPKHSGRLPKAFIYSNADSRLRGVADDAWDTGNIYQDDGDKSARRARRWRWIADVLAVCSALLAATAGIVELAWHYRTATIALALGAAVVSALLAGLRPIDRAASAKAYAEACWGVSGDVRDLNHRLAGMSIDEAAEELSVIRKRAQQASKTSLDIGPNPQT
jgi:hypothetical protein